MLFKSKNDTNVFKRLVDVTEELSHITDIDSLLDRILYEARKFTNADAGSIYLIEGNKLKFSYVQNDSLFQGDHIYNKYLYSNHEIDIDDKSIAGYVAYAGNPVIIKDAYEISKKVPYSFNVSFDKNAGYLTKSLLTVPLKTSRDTVVGVMQIINAIRKHKIMPFSDSDKLYVSHFANNAAIAIERAKMTREMVLKMIKMTELRDPHETGKHVNRVGSYAIEIYDKWASTHEVPEEEIKRTKDGLRIAAMLHDIGKVAISDAILKKPAKLTTDEYNTMKYHTVFGARLFQPVSSKWDFFANEVALNHHERWDGKGYPGEINNIFSNNIKMQKGKRKEEIPINGRIVALADVYDALISKRVYKDAWKETDVLDYIKNQSGEQFDPEVVDSFISIYDVIKAIRTKYIE